MSTILPVRCTACFLPLGFEWESKIRQDLSNYDMEEMAKIYSKCARRDGFIISETMALQHLANHTINYNIIDLEDFDKILDIKDNISFSSDNAIPEPQEKEPTISRGYGPDDKIIKILSIDNEIQTIYPYSIGIDDISSHLDLFMQKIYNMNIHYTSDEIEEYKVKIYHLVNDFEKFFPTVTSKKYLNDIDAIVCEILTQIC